MKINDDDHTFTLDEEALEAILNDEKVKDKPVCIVSVAGKISSFDTSFWRQSVNEKSMLINLPKRENDLCKN